MAVVTVHDMQKRGLRQERGIKKAIKEGCRYESLQSDDQFFFLLHSPASTLWVLVRFMCM